ncbi:LCP family protein [Streptomyces purpureus]|uniref:Transcriptional regulator n=1 Tax=Streptomyces purpureus TaxID=1951 RepID=A0A918LPZ3_9ACTN|nr:LCP family protein [Streptomyces purpureus]GGT35635.1 transcriptional regulator [Streptomyces purpureus]
MGQSSVRGEGTRKRVSRARDLGWDDSLYAEGADGNVPSQREGSGGGGRSGRGGSGGGGDRGPGGGGRSRGRRRGNPRRRARSGKRRIFRWIAIVLSLLILGTAGAGYLYYQHLNSNIRSGGRAGGESGVKKPNANGNTALNILLIGSDSRAKAENVALGGGRDLKDAKPLADVQMLLHISADRKNASVISIPRDTMVQVPECRDDKGETYRSSFSPINETLQRGGPGCTLTTWESITGVYVDHWMMIDFAGVVSMADAIGGVKVCVEHGVWDRPTRQVKGGSGLKIPAGDNIIKGEDALKWLRTRHAFYSDQGRSKAQHMYMNSMIRTLKSQSVWTDTGRLMDLAEAGTKALQVSEEIGTVKGLFDVAMQLKDVPTNRITMMTMPAAEWSQNKNKLVPVEKDADKLWAMLREDVAFDKNGKPADAKPSTAPSTPAGPAAAAPNTLGVTVVNGTGGGGEASIKGRAGRLKDVLRGKGFTQASASQSGEPRKDTVVRYAQKDGAQGKADALSVATALGIPPTAVRADAKAEGLTLVIGADWREGDTFAKPKPVEGDLPENVEASNGADESGCMPVYEPYRWNGKD